MNIEIDEKNIPQDIMLHEYFLLYLVYTKDKELGNILKTLSEDYLDKVSSGLEYRLYIKRTCINPEGWIFRKKTLDMFNGLNSVSSVDTLAERIRDLFPKGLKSGGYLVKSSLKDIKDKLKKFQKDYKYSDEVIIKGTKTYITEMQKNGYAYMMLAKYFILKQDKGSTLADYCEMVENNEIPDEEFVDRM